MKKIIVLAIGLLVLSGFMLQPSSADNEALDKKIRVLEQKAEEAAEAGRENDVREIIRVIEHLKRQREDEHEPRDEKDEHAEIEEHLHQTHKHLDHLLNAAAEAFRAKDKQRAEKIHRDAREVAHRLIELEIRARIMHHEHHGDHEHGDHEHGDQEGHEHGDHDHGDHEHADHDDHAHNEHGDHDGHDHAEHGDHDDHGHNHDHGDKHLEDAKERLMHLYRAAEHLKAAGGHEEAEHVFNKANEMKEHLHREMQRRQGDGDKHGANNGQSLERVMHVVHELHERMATMAEELEEAHERIGDLERLVREDEDEDEDEDEEGDDDR
jgi:hypothetical protein